MELKAICQEDIDRMAVEAGIPENDREEVIRYVEREIRGLHEGNLIRCRPRQKDLIGFVNR
ncbi:MAG: hypothetical protein OXI60_11000 [Acidiferrobacterales bacterium]|nr:hypothetical protein [Acidiferrobacterales bacterium]